MRLSFFHRSVAALACLLVLGHTALSGGPAAAKSPNELVVRGRYLVNFGGCNHCHSPKTMSPKGAVTQTSKLLSGHPADSRLPEMSGASFGPGKWAAMTNAEMTAWFGPWGVSFASNLTPDPATGIGGWTEENFISSLRTGKHMGTGRQILPPMPWEDIGRLTDQDLKAIFAYLKSIPPIHNAVPQPMPPAAADR